MKRSAKHQATKTSFADFTGGINIALSPEQIGESDMQVCENFIYQQGSRRLVGRGGLADTSFSFDSNIKEMHYDVGSNTINVFCEDKKAYLLDYTAKTNAFVGSVTGDGFAVCAKFQNKLWVASGGKIQYLDYAKADLFTVLDSPNCDICFGRNARIFCTKTGDDKAYYSSVGDGALWEENTNDASSSQWLEIGYGDDGDICAVVPLATDLMFIKSNGMVYQFIGDSNPDSWQIVKVASNTDVIGTMCATNIGSSVVFLSMRGLKSLNAVMEYGNISSSDIGDKFNRLITKGLVSNPRFFHLKRYSTILIRPTSDHSYFVSFNYLLGSATVLRFALPISSVVETKDEILVSSGTKIYKITDVATTDAGEKINYVVQPRDIISSDKLLVRAVDASFSSDYAGTATISTDKLAVSVPTNTRKKVLCNHSTARISLKIESNDRFALEHITLDISGL